MITEPENRVLEMLRRLDAKMDRVIDDIADLKRRVTALEEGQAALAQGLAGVNRWLDRLEARVDRIEHRLDLAGLPAQAGIMPLARPVRQVLAAAAGRPGLHSNRRRLPAPVGCRPDEEARRLDFAR